MQGPRPAVVRCRACPRAQMVESTARTLREGLSAEELVGIGWRVEGAKTICPFCTPRKEASS